MLRTALFLFLPLTPFDKTTLRLLGGRRKWTGKRASANRRDGAAHGEITRSRTLARAHSRLPESNKCKHDLALSPGKRNHSGELAYGRDSSLPNVDAHSCTCRSVTREKCKCKWRRQERERKKKTKRLRLRYEISLQPPVGTMEVGVVVAGGERLATIAQSKPGGLLCI